MKVLVTGASGFIGSSFVRFASEEFPKWNIIGLVRHTKQSSLARISGVNGNFLIQYGDLLGDISGLCEGVDWVVNFAAKTFVDHSIRDAIPFVEANVLGTANLLEEARRCKVKRFIQVSTDEVYGQCLEGAYDETATINPRNPYAAAKAGADALATSYAHTYGLHTTITRTENNYGPWQHPQKALPTFTAAALAGEALPVYGDGQHVRQWLWVDDHVTALVKLLHSDYPPGEVFHVAGSQELKNIDLARMILRTLGKSEDRIRFIPDHDIRPGHDKRYALKCDKMRALGWKPTIDLETGIPMAVRWYEEHAWWK